uniref:hypothetical protein n=1 Tax=Anabaena sp. (strain CA / ATCC 33047) TaxID=52271 RepID=UPI00082E5423
KINSINTGSGISNNMMAYRLSLIMQQAKDQPVLVDNNQNPQEHQEELRKLLSKSHPTHNIEEFRRNLKHKYYLEYLHKFESKLNTQSPEPNASTRIERLIAEKKSQFLPIQLSKLERTESLSALDAQNIPAVIEQTSSQPVLEVQNIQPAQRYIRSPEEDETTKKYFIPAIMGLIASKGQSKDDNSRTYESAKYTLHFLIQEGTQFLSVHRKHSQPKKAFSAYNDENHRDFRVLENNLQPQEIHGFIQVYQRTVLTNNQTQLHHKQHKHDEPELGD